MGEKIYVIACAVLAVDLKFHARKMGMDLEYRFLEAGLHNNPNVLQDKLQKAIDDICAEKDACRIVIGYGVCGKGTIGVRSRSIPLVIPKVHDCIALFLGGDRAYKEQFDTYPGTYYFSAGWCEEHTEPMSQRIRQTWFGSERIEYDDLVESLTTKWDYTIGIGNALNKLDRNLLESVELVALSTTLATNAIVENVGQSVGMLLMLPAGMRENIAYEPKAIIQGELDISGNERVAVDRDQILAVAEKMMNHHGVTAFAVSGYAGSINPVHELAVKEILRQETGLFVSCGHELSDRLNFQTRAVTAMLNARIIPKLVNLLLDLEKVMAERSIRAPVLVVKGDGTLMSVEMAKERPVETILSGPAASVAGARHLTGIEKGKFLIGPRRVAPIAWLNTTQPEAARTIAAMGRNLNRYCASTRKMQVLLYTGTKSDVALTPLEETVLTALAARPMSIRELTACIQVPSAHSLPLLRLEENGMIQRCGFTPADLLHITGQFVEWDADMAGTFAGMLAYLSGRELDEMVAHLLEKVTRMLTFELLKRQLDEEAAPEAMDACPVCRILVDNLMTGGRSDYQVRIKLKRPVIGIGAPVRHFLPHAVKPLETEAVLPEDADVANAIGAITSEVVVERQLRLIPGEGGFIIEGIEDNRKFKEFEKADEYAKVELTRRIRDLARQAGTSCNTVTLTVEDQMPRAASGLPIFIGRVIKGSLSGRPDRLIAKPP